MLRGLLLCALTTSALTLATTAVAAAERARQGSSNAQQSSAAKLSQASALAKLVAPEHVEIETAFVNFKAGFLDGVRKTGDIETVEEETPGITRQIFARARPIISVFVRKWLPTLWERMATTYARELTPGQLADLINFFQSPAGRKLIRQRVPKVELPAITGEETASAVVMSPEEDAALLKFVNSDSMAAMERTGPAIKKIRDAWAEESDPEFEKAIEEMIASFSD